MLPSISTATRASASATDGPAPALSGGRRPSESVTRARTPRRDDDGAAALAFLSPGLLGFAAFIVLPLLGAFAISLFDWPLFGAPEFVGAANYVRMLEDPTFYTAMGNTAVFAIVYTVINLLLALFVALWLNTRMKFAGLWRVIFFVPVITPMVANTLVWQLMLSDQGLLNAALRSVGLEGRFWLSDPSLALGSVIAMSVWQSFGYNVVIVAAGLGGIPKDILEAARVDGANAWRRLRHMLLPMLSPSLFFASTMTMIGAFQVFVQVQFLTAGGPGESTNTLVLYLYRNGFVFDRLGYASALAWVLFLVVMVVTAIQFAGQRRWVTYDQ